MSKMYNQWLSNIFFDKHEFACPCCDNSFVLRSFIAKLTNARFRSDVPFVINSGYRCLSYNTYIGSKPTSSHIRFVACDISTPNSLIRQKILFGLILAGFTRIGIYPSYIHVDSDPNKPNAIWM